jgi:hypothetical protein
VATESDIAQDSEKKPIALSDEVRAELHTLYEKYSDLCENPDALAQPLRGIAGFVKKEGGQERDA